MTARSPQGIDLGAVAEIIRECEAAEIAPRFRRLAAGDIEEKTPGEVVTAADRACEALLTRRLVGIADIPVIGEEAVAANPLLLDGLRSDTTCWLVDPLDGTANFASGSPDYAVMVAYLHHGVTTASWIWVPATAELFMAERGAGATGNGEAMLRQTSSRSSGELDGVIKERFLPHDLRELIPALAAEMGTTRPGTNCAGIDYPKLVRGEFDYILYWRTLPWDHAPGALLAAEAGCTAVRPDGSAYEPHSRRDGLLAAPRSIVDHVLDRLLGAVRPH